MAKLTRRSVLLGATGVVAAGAGYVVLRPRDGEVLAIAAVPAMADTGAPGAGRDVVEMSLGDPDAPVTVIEYASLTCPHCATFHREVFPRLREAYIDTGQVHFISREVYFDRPGLWGAMLARCAGEDRYFGMLDLLYAEQATWSRAPDAPAIVEHLYGIGRQAGMTRETMDACLSDADFAQALVAEYQANASEHGIQSTPSFVINGETTGNIPWSEFQARIEAALPD